MTFSAQSQQNPRNACEATNFGENEEVKTIIMLRSGKGVRSTKAKKTCQDFSTDCSTCQPTYFKG